MILHGCGAQALLLLAATHTSEAWTTIQTSKTVQGARPFNRLPIAHTTSSISQTVLFAEAEDGGNAPKRKRKRKKKAQVIVDEDSSTIEEEEAPAPAAPVLELKPRDDAPVTLQVNNILASTTPPEPSTLSKVSDMLLQVTRSKDDSSGTAEKPSPPTRDMSSIGDVGGRSLDDSLGQLLEDARLMTEEEKDAQNEKGMLSDEEGTDLKKTIGNVLSTIVTADFFVVCGFLLWFLLGIFCSYVLKDDTVQIAFNNQFEALVQPALGVLMIAAIGGSFFKEDEEQ